MAKLIKVLIILIDVILIIACLATFIINIVHKDYYNVAKLLSVILWMCLGLIIDSKVIKALSEKSNHAERLLIIAWVIYTLIILVTLFGYVLTNNDLIEHILKGIQYPSIYFGVKYFNAWLDYDDNHLV